MFGGRRTAPGVALQAQQHVVVGLRQPHRVLGREHAAAADGLRGLDVLGDGVASRRRCGAGTRPPCAPTRRRRRGRDRRRGRRAGRRRRRPAAWSRGRCAARRRRSRPRGCHRCPTRWSAPRGRSAAGPRRRRRRPAGPGSPGHTDPHGAAGARRDVRAGDGEGHGIARLRARRVDAHELVAVAAQHPDPALAKGSVVWSGIFAAGIVSTIVAVSGSMRRRRCPCTTTGSRRRRRGPGSSCSWPGSSSRRRSSFAVAGSTATTSPPSSLTHTVPSSSTR